MDKGLLLYVYRHPLGDFSNGGISGRVDQVTLVSVDGKPLDRDSQVFEPSPTQPPVTLVKRWVGGVVWHVEPVEPVPANHTPYMDGGAYVASSDNRVRALVNFYGAIALHDRTDTWEQYNALTR